MTRKQAIAIFVAIVAVIVVFRIPPYCDDGGIIGGTVYYPFSRPPAHDPYIFPDVWLLKVELSFVALSLSTALLAVRRRAPRRQQTALIFGLVIEALVFAANVRSFNMVLGPEFTFYLLNLLAVVLLVVVVLRGRGPNPNPNPDPRQYPV